MKNFDLLISTSHRESLPLSIIEALSMSIPVVSTNVGDVSYVLNKHKCGFIQLILKQMSLLILFKSLNQKIKK